MCVIIVKEPEFPGIPYDKLETACDINKDGFGLSWIERGRIKTIRDLSKNDPKLIQKELNKHAKRRYFLHLRHATVGQVILQNSHPFFPLTRSDGLEVGFMHNGTLFDYKPDADSPLSDSYNFQEKFLRPVLLRLHAFGKDEVLDDPVLAELLKDKTKYGESVIVLFDNTGRTAVAGKAGVKYLGWWASNDYSFDTNHVRSSKRQSFQSRVWGPSGTSSDYGRTSKADELGLPWLPKSDDINLNMASWEEDLKNMDTASALDLKAFNEIQSEIWAIGKRVNDATTGKDSLMQTADGVTFMQLDAARETFLKAANLKQYSDLGRLSAAQIAELCQEYPNGMAYLIVDLLADKYTGATEADPVG